MLENSDFYYSSDSGLSGKIYIRLYFQFRIVTLKCLDDGSMFSDKDSVPDIKFNTTAEIAEQRLDSAEIEWSNLEVGGIGLPNKIIKGVSGCVKPGTLMACVQSNSKYVDTLHMYLR